MTRGTPRLLARLRSAARSVHARGMAICEVCGNDYDKTFSVVNGRTHRSTASSARSTPSRRRARTAAVASSATASRRAGASSAAPTARTRAVSRRCATGSSPGGSPSAPSCSRRGPGRRAPGMETTTHYRTCPLCEATCGLEITTRGREVVAIRGDEREPVQPRLPLPEGPGAEAPRRRPRPPAPAAGPPRRRLVGRRLGRGVRGDRAPPARRSSRDHGRDAVGVYLGNPSVHSLAAGALPARRCSRASARATSTPPAPSTRCRSRSRAGLMFGARAHHPGARHRPHRTTCSSSAPIPSSRTAA